MGQQGLVKRIIHIAFVHCFLLSIFVSYFNVPLFQNEQSSYKFTFVKDTSWGVTDNEHNEQSIYVSTWSVSLYPGWMFAN